MVTIPNTIASSLNPDHIAPDLIEKHARLNQDKIKI
jgi:hypothetical protein